MAWSGVGHHSAGPVPIVTATLDDGMPAKLAALASAASAAAAASQPGLPPGPDLKAATAADSYSTPNGMWRTWRYVLFASTRVSVCVQHAWRHLAAWREQRWRDTCAVRVDFF